MVKQYIPIKINLTGSLNKIYIISCMFFLFCSTSYAQADLSITKSVDNNAPNVGDEITFTITLSNDGPEVATGVTVRDVIPTGYANLLNISNGGNIAGTNGTEILWENLTIPVGSDVVTLTLTATVQREGEYNNRAEIIASNQADPNSDPNTSFDNDDLNDGLGDNDETDFVLVTPKRADLSLTKTVDNASPEVGEQVTFLVTLTNAGPDIATGVAIRDVIPNGYGNVANISNGGTSSDDSILWSGITINPNQSIEFTITATVLATGDYNNRAEIIASDVDDPNSDPNTSFDDDDFNDGIADNDETDFVEVAPLIADLSITKEASSLNPNIGREVDFTITVTNNGPLDATNIVVSDVLTSGFIYLSDDAFGDYSSDTGVWNITSLLSGESISLNITAIVSLEDNYTNTASIVSSDTFDPNDANDVATITLDPEEVFYAEGFSPNGDGINDTFEIPGLGYLYPDFKIEIFNRWGNKVYDYANNGRTTPVWWDGYSNGNLTFNGSKQVPTGTYFYVIYFNKDNKEPISNWVYLNR